MTFSIVKDESDEKDEKRAKLFPRLVHALCRCPNIFTQQHLSPHTHSPSIMYEGRKHLITVEMVTNFRCNGIFRLSLSFSPSLSLRLSLDELLPNELYVCVYV
jgi:hypothetical protein